MFIKSYTESTPQNGSTPNVAAARGALTVSPHSEANELPDVAVAKSSSSQAAQHDLNALERHTHIFGKIRAAVETAYRRQQELDELEKIRTKLLLGADDKAFDDIVLLGQGQTGPDSVINTDVLIAGSAKRKESEKGPLTTPHAKEPTNETPADSHSVLNKIEDALNRIGELKDKIGKDEAEAYYQLLSFNVSVSGLNIARSQVDDSSYSVSAASAVVETIMTNLRSAVIAHGTTSPDVVRLVLAG